MPKRFRSGVMLPGELSEQVKCRRGLQAIPSGGISAGGGAGLRPPDSLPIGERACAPAPFIATQHRPATTITATATSMPNQRRRLPVPTAMPISVMRNQTRYCRSAVARPTQSIGPDRRTGGARRRRWCRACVAAEVRELRQRQHAAGPQERRIVQQPPKTRLQRVVLGRQIVDPRGARFRRKVERLIEQAAQCGNNSNIHDGSAGAEERSQHTAARHLALHATLAITIALQPRSACPGRLRRPMVPR